MSATKKPTQKPQRITTPAPEVTEQPDEETFEPPETPTSVEDRLAALVNPLERIARAMELTAVAQSQVRDVHLERHRKSVEQEQNEEIQRLTAGHLPGSDIKPMRG